jgi:hypothetical protein
LTEEETREKSIKKRVVKKNVGKKQEITEIVTTEEKGNEPQTPLSIIDSEISIEELEDITPKDQEETVPKILKDTQFGDVTIREVLEEEDIPEQSVRKRVTKKKMGKKQEFSESLVIDEKELYSEEEPQPVIDVPLDEDEQVIEISSTDESIPHIIEHTLNETHEDAPKLKEKLDTTSEFTHHTYTNTKL